MLAKTAGTLIARNGLGKATIREVARAAGVSTGTVSHYYQDSQELLQAAYGTAFRSSSARFMSALSQDDSLEGLLNALCTALPLDDTALREWRVRLAFWGAGEFEEAITHQEADASGAFRGVIARTLKGLAAPGRDGVTASANASARTIEVLLIGTAIQCLLMQGITSKQTVKKRFKEQVLQEVAWL